MENSENQKMIESWQEVSEMYNNYRPAYTQPVYPQIQYPQPMAAQTPMQPTLPQVPAQAQTAMQQPQAAANYICQPVASEEEARAVPTDFSGATQVLLDCAHGMIYTKRLNFADGSAIFSSYRLAQPTPPATQEAYAPMRLVEQLQAEIEEIKSALTEQRKPNRKAADQM